MVLHSFCSGPIHTNTYLLWCEASRRAAVVDAPADCTAWVVQCAKDQGLTIEKILLTHSHWDHIAGLWELKQRVDVPVCVHTEDAENVRLPGSDGLPLPFPIQGVDVGLDASASLQLGELCIEVIHTPGHTPGGVCFYLPEQSVLFSGDTLFKGTMGSLALPTARPTLMWGSLRKLAKLPPHVVVYPGHGDATEIGKERWLQRAEEYFGGMI